MSQDKPFDVEYTSLNQFAAIYDDYAFDRRMRHYMMRALAPHLNGCTGKALEMGCFQGEFTTLLAERFADLTVVDAASEFIEATRRRVGDRVCFVNSLFETFETDSRFDAIFLMHVMEHLDDPVAVLTKAKNLLAPGGRILLVVPNGRAASRQIAVKMGVIPTLTSLTEADVKHGHRRVYCFDGLEHEARTSGLQVIHRGGVFFKPLANFQFEKLIGGDVVSDAYLEGCFALGMEYPDLCASIFLVCTA